MRSATGSRDERSLDRPSSGHPSSGHLASDHQPTDHPLRYRPPRWSAPVFLAFALVLTPWTVGLAVALPSHATTAHYRLAWVGLDVMILVLLARVAWLAHQRSPRAELPAVALAVLLLADAWLDITLASSTGARMQAVALAIFGELPTALLAMRVAHAVERPRLPALSALSRLSRRAGRSWRPRRLRLAGSGGRPSRRRRSTYAYPGE